MSVTPSYIQVAPDSTGKKMECVQLTDDNSNVVQREMVCIGDPANVDQRAFVDANGNLNISGALTPAITPTETNPNVIATGSGTQLFASNANAKYRFFQNTTATPAWVSLDGTAPAIGKGMYVGPYGDFEMSRQNGNLVSGIIKGISTSGTIAFYCVEGV